MSTLIDNLNYIESCKLDIKSAIEAKGVDMTDVSFPGYAEAIGSITTQFVTESLSVSQNGTYYPEEGVDGFSEVSVDVPQSVTGFTEKDITEGQIIIVNLSNSASYVASQAFMNNTQLLTVDLSLCTKVYDQAFATCRNLSQVSLPICTTLSNSVFMSCYSLSEINLPECVSIGSADFYNCSLLSQVSLPKCKSISNQAFQSCPVKEMTLPSCTYISTGAFMYCSMLSHFDAPLVSYLGTDVFRSCKSLSQLSLSLVKTIGSRCFQDCISLSQVSIPNCSIIENGAFTGCFSLSQLDSPNVLSISNSAFTQCYALSSLSWPKCMSIGGVVFEQCSALTELDFPALYYISGAAFNNCTNLTTIKIPALVSGSYWYGNGAFLTLNNLSQLYIGLEHKGVMDYNYLFSRLAESAILFQGVGSIYVNSENYDAYTTANGWTSLSSLMVSVEMSKPLLSYSEGVVSGLERYPDGNIFTYLGINQSSITQITLDCYSVSNGLFSNCNNLVSIDLASCIIISQTAFQSCTALNSVSIPNCKLLGSSAFKDTSLSELYLTQNWVVELMNYNAFDSTTSIFVPSSLLSDYQTAPKWSNISSRIFPIPE